MRVLFWEELGGREETTCERVEMDCELVERNLERVETPREQVESDLNGPKSNPARFFNSSAAKTGQLSHHTIFVSIEKSTFIDWTKYSQEYHFGACGCLQREARQKITARLLA